MSNDNGEFTPFDPMATMKNVRSASMDSWSKLMIQIVNSEAYAQATSVTLDAGLTSLTPFRKMIETTLTQVLTNLALPTRADVVRLAERLTNIEFRLDDLDALLESTKEGTSKRPRRNKLHLDDLDTLLESIREFGNERPRQQESNGPPSAKK